VKKENDINIYYNLIGLNKNKELTGVKTRWEKF